MKLQSEKILLQSAVFSGLIAAEFAVIAAKNRRINR